MVSTGCSDCVVSSEDADCVIDSKGCDHIRYELKEEVIENEYGTAPRNRGSSSGEAFVLGASLVLRRRYSSVRSMMKKNAATYTSTHGNVTRKDVLRLD